MQKAMNNSMRFHFTCAVLAVSALLAACGEKPQTATVRKLDVAPAQGSQVAGFTAQGWKAGDATSWETQIKKRAEGQNEYTRTQRN
jgi:ABC-type uncharacterized transport system auxiliary subunit